MTNESIEGKMCEILGIKSECWTLQQTLLRVNISIIDTMIDLTICKADMCVKNNIDSPARVPREIGDVSCSNTYEQVTHI